MNDQPEQPVCPRCDEIVGEGEASPIRINGRPAHAECVLRGVMGSVAHIEGRCSCYVPGATCTDPPGMTRRQAAQAARDAWFKRKRWDLPGQDLQRQHDADQDH